MSGRQRFTDCALWLASLWLASMPAASSYQHILLILVWCGALPRSVVTSFLGMSAGAAIEPLGKGVLPATALPVLATVAANWLPTAAAMPVPLDDCRRNS